MRFPPTLNNLTRMDTSPPNLQTNFLQSSSLFPLPIVLFSLCRRQNNPFRYDTVATRNMTHHRGRRDDSQRSRRAGRPRSSSKDSNATSSSSRQNPRGSDQGNEGRAIQRHFQGAANLFARQHDPNRNADKHEKSLEMTSKSNDITFNKAKFLNPDKLHELMNNSAGNALFRIVPLYTEGRALSGVTRKRPNPAVDGATE